MARSGNVQSKDGIILTTEKEQLGRWAEHFSEVLNRDSPTTEAVFREGTELQIDTGPFSLEEVKIAILALKNKKAVGIDGLPAEVFKVCLGESVKVFLILTPCTPWPPVGSPKGGSCITHHFVSSFPPKSL